jgi:preprotein translocase subunit SecE
MESRFVAKTVKNSKTNSSASAGKRGNASNPKAKARAQQSKASARGAKGRGDKSKTTARPGEKKGFTKFLRDVRVEMSKVTWPTRRDLVQSTLVVLVAVTIVGFYIALLDTVFRRMIGPIERALTSILT